MFNKQTLVVLISLVLLPGCGSSGKKYSSEEFGFEIISPPGWHQKAKNDVISLTLTLAKSKKRIEENPHIQVIVQPEMGYDALGYLKQLLSGINRESVTLDNVPIEYLAEPTLTDREGLNWAQCKIRLKDRQESFYVLVTERQSYILKLKLLGKYDEKELERLFLRVWMSFKLLK